MHLVIVQHPPEQPEVINILVIIIVIVCFKLHTLSLV